MRETMTIILAILSALSIASFSFADEKATEKKAPIKEEEKAQPNNGIKTLKVMLLIGDVKSIDVKAKTITIVRQTGDKSVETAMTLVDETKIMSGQNIKKPADLKAGNKVRIKYTEVDGKRTAKLITIIQAEAVAPTEKKTGTAKHSKPKKKNS